MSERTLAALRHQPGDGALGDVEAELQKFPVDSRSAPRGLAVAIRVTRARISAVTRGRPTEGRAEGLVQYSRKRRRCRRTTVSGLTMMSACFQLLHTWASTTQKSRSAVRSFGRLTVRWYTASW